MHFRIQVVTVADDGAEHLHELAVIEREETTPETLGLSLHESKSLLGTLQQTMVQCQMSDYLQKKRPCPHCQIPRPIKDTDTAPFRTLFGKVQVSNPRWHHCICQLQKTHTFRPLAALLSERTSPELLYLETKWSSLLAYNVTFRLMSEVLPLDIHYSAVTVRNHLLAMAQRSEQQMGEVRPAFVETCQRERNQLPLPHGPLSVGLDGGYVRLRKSSVSKHKEQAGNFFEVIAGKSILAFRGDEHEETIPSSKCFALVGSIDPKPKRRLYTLLQSQGMQENQQITFFSDGGDNVRSLPQFLHPDSEHILDWFHITMRLTVLKQCARGLDKPEPSGETAVAEENLEARLERIKHFLWHGNHFKALPLVEDLQEDLEIWDNDEEGEPRLRSDRDAAAQMAKYVQEFSTYLRNNKGYIVNYGERYRNGERISTGFVESTINQVVSKRMVKKQQMQWTPKGAHLLLQVRTQVLNEDWDKTFRKWYPGFRPVETPSMELPMAA